jgi:hypothetical protein
VKEKEWFVWLVLCGWLNQMNESDQRDQTDRSYLRRAVIDFRQPAKSEEADALCSAIEKRQAGS